LLRLRPTASIFWLYFENLKTKTYKIWCNLQCVWYDASTTTMFQAYIVVFCVTTAFNPLNGDFQCFGMVILPPSSAWVSSIKMRTEFAPKRRYTTYYWTRNIIMTFKTHHWTVSLAKKTHKYSCNYHTHARTHTHRHTIFFKVDFLALLLSAPGSLIYYLVFRFLIKFLKCFSSLQCTDFPNPVWSPLTDLLNYYVLFTSLHNSALATDIIVISSCIL
jgi:hypothetical protein